MITAPVSQEQLAFWKKLWEQNRSSLQPNRITGAELNAYFCKKYAPAILDDPGFREVVHDNLMQRYSDRLELFSGNELLLAPIRYLCRDRIKNRIFSY